MTFPSANPFISGEESSKRRRRNFPEPFKGQEESSQVGYLKYHDMVLRLPLWRWYVRFRRRALLDEGKKAI